MSTFNEIYPIDRSGHGSLYVIIRDYVILNFFKLLNGNKENYSFQNLINNIEDESLRLDLKKHLSAVKKNYNELRIDKIRNKHVGHQDHEREKESISWTTTEKLLDNCEDLHDKISSSLSEPATVWDFEEGKLRDLLKDRSIRMEIVKLYRNAKKENKTSVDLKEIEKIITGPNN